MLEECSKKKTVNALILGTETWLEACCAWATGSALVARADANISEDEHRKVITLITEDGLLSVPDKANASMLFDKPLVFPKFDANPMKSEGAFESNIKKAVNTHKLDSAKFGV